MASESNLVRRNRLLLLGAGIVLEAFFLRMHGLYYLKNHAIGFIELALAAGVVYLLALYGFAQSKATRASTILLIFAAIAFRAPLWPMEPTLSDDLQRYRWEAKVQAHGWNPYAIAPNDLQLRPLRDNYYEIMPGRELPAIYPPASELVFRATWKFFPGPTSFKTAFAAADVLVLLLLAWMFWNEKDRDFRLAVYAWNPLVIVEFAGSGHNDVLALLGIVCGLALIKKWPSLASVPVALAAMAKVFPAVLLPVWIRRAGWPGKKAGWWAAGLAIVAGFAVLLPYWNALGMFRANMTYYEATWKNYHASLYTLIDLLTGGKTRIPALVGVTLSWGLALWLAWKKAEPARAAYLLIGTILAFGPNGYSWYFTWIVPLLCYFPNPAWLMLTVLQFLSYNVLVGYGILAVFKFDPFLQWLVYAPFYLVLIGHWLNSRRHVTQHGTAAISAALADPER
ncbi:MAG TPA: glycosyltransferase 87 family protein [Candidatus Limnocylindrales bacterium]|nr:glycosyltransferase 87 family protein [Candidatus Limnocylindrales bacterium]